jgi:Domain of unknown function (DUF3576)
MHITSPILRTLLALSALLVALPSCSFLKPDAEQKYPKTEEDRRKDERGKITGDEGISLGGAKEKDGESGKNPFLPITSADPFGGTVLTDWYEDPEAPGERHKLNVLILDRQLRADSLKITTFRQTKNKAGDWVDASTDAKLGRKLEDTVLTRARELRVKQLGY